MNKSKLIYLYQQYLANTCTIEELHELEILLKDPALENEFINLLDDSWNDAHLNSSKDISASKADQIYLRIIQDRPQQKVNFKLWMYIAAAIFMVASIGLLFYKDSPKETNAPQQAKIQMPATTEIMPGSNKAILTLGNGHTVVLDDAKSGQIASDRGVVINKLSDGQLSYSATKNSAVAIEQNTIAIPKGGQYHLILPDGTSVFLNSESALTYPTKFTGNNRNVTLKGEAYFEVTKNPKMPFLVNVNDRQQVEVLGTHFNVKAYTDEQTINTTLLEGSVKVIANHKEVKLKPGQAAINHPSKSLSVEPADLEEAMAWKNGLFVFNNENITSVMKKIARWYNIEVVFEGNMEKANFIGNYSRSKSLNNLLKNIELTDEVHFRSEGRRITVIAN